MLKCDNEESFLKYVIDAINNDKLIVFVGSGVSKLCGLPLWRELAELLLQDCVNDKKCKFDYKNKHEILQSISDERELISIAENLLKNAHGTRDVFIKYFNKKLKKFKKAKALEIQELLFGICKTIFTTNADESLDQNLDKQNVIYNIDNFKAYKKDLSVNKIIHIHGSVQDGKSLVFTTADYLKRYSKKIFRDEMCKLFSGADGYVILFIGYGFREMQLLDFLVTPESASRENKAFFLNGYFSKDETVFDVEAEYYKEYGITLVAYERDKEDFRALIGALRDIKDKADKALKAILSSFQSITYLLNKAPCEQSLLKFSEGYRLLPLKFKPFLLESVSKSKYSKEWTKGIILDSSLNEEVFSLNELVQVEPSPDSKEIVGVPFPGLSLLTRVDAYSDDTKSFYDNFINDVIDKYLSDNELFANHVTCLAFLKLIFSHKEFLESGKIIPFLKRFVEQSNDSDIWMTFASYKTDILKDLEKSKWLEFVEIIRLTIQKNGGTSYSINSFFDIYSKKLCEECAEEIIVYIVEDLKRIFYDHSYLEFSYEPFEWILDSNRDYDTQVTFLRRWLAETLPFLNKSNAAETFIKYSSEDNVFSKLVAIYLANVKFGDLQRLFFDSIKIFSERIYFSEIYSLLSKNVNRIEECSLEQIVDFINEIKFDDGNGSLFYKYSLTKLLLERFPGNDKIKTMFESFDRSIKTQNLESNFNDFNPLDGSKLIRVEIRPYDSPFADHLLSLTSDEFIDSLKNVSESERSNFLLELSNSFEKIDGKFKLFDRETIESLRGSPDFILDFLEHRLAVKQDEFNVKLTLFLDIEKQKAKPFSNNGFVNNLYELVSTNYISDQNLITRLFERVWNCPITVGNNSPDYLPLSIQDVYSNVIFHKYSLLLLTCTKEKIDTLKDDFESRLKSNDIFAKAAMVSKIQYLWSYDRKWTSSHLREMFDCNCNNENLAFYMFAFSSLYKSDFVEALYKKGILSKLLKSQEFSSFAQQYSYLLLCNFVYKSKNASALEIISKTNYWQNSLSLLIDYATRTNRDNFNKERFDHILCIFKGGSARNNFSCLSAIKVLNFLNSNEITDYDEKYVLFALSGRNNAAACEKLKNAILGKKFKPSFVDKVIEMFFKNIIDVYLYEREIVELFNLIHSKKVKETVCNLLGKINPNLFEKLKEESN